MFKNDSPWFMLRASYTVQNAIFFYVIEANTGYFHDEFFFKRKEEKKRRKSVLTKKWLFCVQGEKEKFILYSRRTRNRTAFVTRTG
jgi:hypothetical protein